MSSKRSSSSFTISWPFIIMCIIGYNLFFSDDEDKKDVDVEPLDEKPAVVETIDEQPNKIDDLVGKIKKEIDTSVVIQTAKDEFKKAKDELTDEFKAKKDELTKEKETVPEPEEKLVEEKAEVKTEPPAKTEPSLEPIDPKSSDNEPQFTDL